MVSPPPPETWRIPFANVTISKNVVSCPIVMDCAVDIETFQYRTGLMIVSGEAASLATAASICRCRSTRPRSPRGSALRIRT